MLFSLITLEDIKNNIGSILLGGFRNLMFVLTTFIYKAITNLYNVFMTICKIKLLDIDLISSIAKRIGVILGLVMFFIVAFSLIQIILDPEKINDKEIGINNIVKKVILVIIMLGSYSFVFTELENIQNILLDNHLIEKLLLPGNYQFDEDKFGKVLSANLFTAFLNYDSESNNTECENEVNSLYASIVDNGDYPIGSCFNTTYTVDNKEKFVIDYNFIFSTLVGVFTCYFLIMYTISVGIRTIQLTFLQIISPAAIIGYLTPKKDNIFTKWCKIYISTYLDVFVRIAIINFCTFMISIVIDAFNSNLTGSAAFANSLGSAIRGPAGMYIEIIMIIALFSFAKKAPELLKELLPAGGASKIGFGFSTKDAPGLGLVAGTVAGAATGVIGGAMSGKGFGGKIRGALSGSASGTVRGFATGMSGKGALETIKTANANQAKANLARAQRITRGTSLKETAADRMRSLLGVQPGFTKLEQELSVSNAVKTELEKDDIIKHIQEVRQSYIQKCAADKQTADANVLKKFDDATKNVQKSMYDIARRGSTSSGNVTAQVFDQNGATLMDLNELYESNPSIYNAIKKNNNRVHREMNTYDEWKADNKEIQRKLSEKSNTGSK